MFQFTSTTILNSNLDSSGKPKWSTYTAPNSDKILSVKRVNNFIGSGVKAAYKRVAANPKLSKSELVVDQWGAGIYQLAIEINYLGSQNSFYARPTNYLKGKPLFYSFELKGTETDAQVAAKIVDIVKYLETRYGDKWINVSAATVPGAEEGDPSVTTLTIDAIDEYQRFVKVAIQQYAPLDKVCGCATDCQCAWVDVLNAEVAGTGGVFPNPNATIVQGREGFGTFTHLMKDLRLPTAANTNWLAVNQEERPIPGELYNQYTFEYVRDRGKMGQSAVGMTATSSTIHVFYVKQSLATAFETALTSAGITLTTVNKPTGYPA